MRRRPTALLTLVAGALALGSGCLAGLPDYTFENASEGSVKVSFTVRDGSAYCAPQLGVVRGRKGFYPDRQDTEVEEEGLLDGLVRYTLTVPAGETAFLCSDLGDREPGPPIREIHVKGVGQGVEVRREGPSLGKAFERRYGSQWHWRFEG